VTGVNTALRRLAERRLVARAGFEPIPNHPCHKQRVLPLHRQVTNAQAREGCASEGIIIDAAPRADHDLLGHHYAHHRPDRVADALVSLANRRYPSKGT
jgi:hypothetical protein